MMTIAAVVPTTPRCVMAINQADQPALNKRASQQFRASQMLPSGQNNALGTTWELSGLNRAARTLAVYASQSASPQPTQDSLPARWLRFGRTGLSR